MSARRVGALVLLAVAAAPAAAPAIDFSGRLGLMYQRADYMPADGQRSSSPYLDIDLALDAKGVLVSRDVVNYQLGVAWTRVSLTPANSAESTTRLLSYRGSASILQNAVSPVGLSLFANRGQSDFSTRNAPDSFGNGIQSTAGVNATVRGERKPTLDLGYTWYQDEMQIADLPTRTSSIHTLTSALSFGTSAFQASASYFGEFRDGSWDTDRYQNHGVTLNASARLGESTLSLVGGSVLTIPNELVPGAIEQKTTSFSAIYMAGAEGTRRYLSYTYGHTLNETPGAPTDELTHQGARYEGDHFTSERFFTRWLADASMGETRSNDTLLRTTGETGGVSLWFRRIVPTSTFEVNAGPRISAIQSSTEAPGQAPVRSDGAGYGAVAGARYSRPMGVHTLSANYEFGWGQDLYATAGWQLQQSVGASLTGPAATARYTMNLAASSFRIRNPVTGDGAGRRVRFSGTLKMPRLTAFFQANLGQGIVGATPQQFASDGLLLPAPFNSITVDVSSGGSYTLFSGLAANLVARYGRSDIPGRPALQEAGTNASLTYRFGGLGVSLEDRYSRTQNLGGQWDVVNVVMVSVYRAIRW